MSSSPVTAELVNREGLHLSVTNIKMRLRRLSRSLMERLLMAER